MKLTKNFCRQVAYSGTGNARCVFWCDDPRGFGLRVFPSGRKSWVLAYRTAGGTKRLATIGDYDVLSLDQARSDAKHELGKIERLHADPLAEKEVRRLQSTAGSVGSLVAAYLDAREADVKRPLRSAVAQRKLAARNIAGKPLGDRPWHELRQGEVTGWHEAFAAQPYVGNRSLALLRAAISWRLAKEAGASPDQRRRKDFNNPAVGVQPFAERPRQTTLAIGDAEKFKAAIATEARDPFQRAFFLFLLATGCRRGEALGLKWADVTIDAAGSRVVFRETKNGTDRVVPITSQTAAVLKKLKPIQGNPHVFVGHRTGSALVGVDKVWGRIRQAIGQPDLRMHDIRRSFGSWLGDHSFSAKQIGVVLGHKSNITSAVYMALSEQSSRSAVAAVEQIMKAAKKKHRRAKSGGV